MPYSCFIIGQDTLLLECATLLRQHGFQIRGIISNDRNVRRYCAENGLRYLDSDWPFVSALEGEAFDYLFSITNDRILPGSVLRLPRRHTINYHDGPLPAYAGVHATFWALVNQEKKHGVTWHLVDAGIDTGAILKQREVPIGPDETSIQLNIKCYSAAVAAFRELVDELVSDSLSIQPQEASLRSYFGRKNRPDLFLNVLQPADQTARLFRALDFGFHPNPFGSLKIRIGPDFLLIKELTVLPEPLLHKPGTLLALDASGLRLSTADGSLLIRTLTALDGSPVSLTELTERYDLRVGQVISQPDDGFRRQYHAADVHSVRYQAYWLEKFRHLSLTTLPFVSDQDDNLTGSGAHETVAVELAPALQSAFESLSRATDQTARLLCAFLIMAARFSNQPSVGLGYSSPESRQRAADHGGLWAACRPFVVHFDWESGFEDAVSAFQLEQKTVEDQWTYTPDWLLGQPVLQATGQAVRERDFPIIFHQSADETDRPTYQNALTLLVSAEGKARIVYDSAVWRASQVAELVGRWLIVLENLMRDPQQPLKTVSTLTPEERQRILVDWNATTVSYPRDRTVSELVEDQVQKRPRAIALRCGDITITYEQLNQRANQLARYWQKLGVQPDTLVGLCTDRSPEMIVGLLAILKAGGAYVPLDPTYPPARLAELIRQTRLQFVLTQQKWLDRLPDEEITGLLLDRDKALWARESTQNLPATARSDNLAYVLFTSGSTGRPKNVAIPHRGIVRLVKGANYVRLDETTVMLGLAPLAFDASTLEVWGSLTNGGELVLIPESLPTPGEIKRTIQTHSVNTAFFTAALFNVLVDSGMTELTSFTQILTGGEAASAEHFHRAQRQLPHCSLINGYGPTESTTFASFHTLAVCDPETSVIPIGKPLSNTQVYIVDSLGNPVPAGFPGELLIGGDGLARGYLFQPKLTAQTFVPDPFSAQPGRRLYRTGDLARYRSDGTIVFLGRADDQVKIRGFRIEPGEIEHALCQHPTVGEAVVVVAEPMPGNKTLVSYLVPKPGAVLVVEDVRTFLQGKLPQHLIPAVLMALKELPLTPNGKLDKRQLPPAFNRNAKPEGQALTPTEQALLPLWTAVLDGPPGSCADNFFDLGGSSILAMQLTARIHQQFGHLVSMKDLFEHPTIRQLAQYLDQNLQDVDDQWVGQERAGVQEAESGIPLSFAQNRLWIIHQLHALNGTYNVPIVLKITGPLNRPVFQQSLEEVVRRHEILRTTFGHEQGVPFQHIAPPDVVPVLVSEPLEPIPLWINREAYRAFDLETGPLLRIRVAQLDPDSWILLLVFHHLIYDGWSTQVLARELSSVYSALVQNKPVDLPVLPLQYADYARWQRGHLTPRKLERERNYWKNRLAGAPILQRLPIDKSRPAIQSFDGNDWVFEVPKPLWQQLRVGFQEPGTTPFLRLLTVFSVWLSRVTQQQDLIVGIPVAGRNRPELAHNIGFFVNTLALRIEIRETHSFRELLRHVRERALEGYDHQELPFEQVVDVLKWPRTLAYTPLVQVMFDVQDDHTKDWKLDGLQVEPVPFEQHTAKFDLHLSFRMAGDGAEGTFNYRSDLFSKSTVQQFAVDFLALMEELVSAPDKPLGDSIEKVENQSSILEMCPKETELPDPQTDLSATDEPLVDQLRSLWCELLEMPAVGLDDDFFELGGHSLLAFRLTADLQRQTGHTIPVGSIFAHPTIRKLVTHLKTAHPDLVWQSLVGVKPQGNQPPLFLVHPISGEIGYVYQLAPYLPANRPVYGLRAVGLNGIASPFSSIEAMAAHYVQLMLEQQPNGPYALGGYSLGGIIAFEMAQQLRQRGREVSLLALIDSYPMNPNTANKIPVSQRLDYYYQYWRSLPKHPVLLWRFFQKKAPAARSFFLNRLRNTLQNRIRKTAVSSTPAHASESGTMLVTSSLQAYSVYAFKPYDGKVVLLRAIGKNGLVDPQRPVTFGWDRYARRGVDVHPIPADHTSLFRDEGIISQIGAVLTSYLNT